MSSLDAPAPAPATAAADAPEATVPSGPHYTRLPPEEWPQPTGRRAASGEVVELTAAQLSTLSMRGRSQLLFVPAGVRQPPTGFQHVLKVKRRPVVSTFTVGLASGERSLVGLVRKSKSELAALRHLRALVAMVSTCNYEQRSAWHHLGTMAGMSTRLARDGTLSGYAVKELLPRCRKRGAEADQQSELHMALPAFKSFEGDHALEPSMCPFPLHALLLACICLAAHTAQGGGCTHGPGRRPEAPAADEQLGIATCGCAAGCTPLQSWPPLAGCTMACAPLLPPWPVLSWRARCSAPRAELPVGFKEFVAEPGLLKEMLAVAVSINLANPKHIDSGDARRCWARWVRRELTRARGDCVTWWFLFPEHSLAVELEDGTGMSWDGVAVPHCTAVPLGVDHTAGDALCSLWLGGYRRVEQAVEREREFEAALGLRRRLGEAAPAFVEGDVVWIRWDRNGTGAARRAQVEIASWDDVPSGRRLTVVWHDSSLTTFEPGEVPAMAHAGATADVQLCGRALIGRRISVYWPAMQQSYVGVVTAFDKKCGHTVAYVDGEVLTDSLWWHSSSGVARAGFVLLD